MSHYTEIMKNPHTLKLEKLSNFHYLYNGLKKKYSQQTTRDKQRVKDFEDNIEEYCKLLNGHKGINEKIIPRDLASPVTHNSDLEEIARRASSYFEQGLQMYITSTKMHINSSPLVEYYSFLQCVKGAVLLNLEINEPKLFSFHGIITDKTYSKPYIKAKIKSFGVFQALILLKNTKDDIKDYIENHYDLRLKILLEGKMIKKIGNLRKDIRTPMDYPIPPFIVSWMLSSLVRYTPKIWQDIYYGVEDSIILKIHEYRRKNIIEAIDSLLPYYYDDKIHVV